jgi:asparagine synthase (glutamine-hydrolysing)
MDLGRMVEILAHRGPDGAEIWREGPVGLGHRMLWTTPESLHEKLPLVNRIGDLVITADARIDNRDELIATLGLTDRPSQELADSQLILAAYEKWGERCPEKLLGDFVFAIWDRRKQVLFCARDHFGIKPFYYYRTDRLFAFASEIKALFCLSEVPRRLDEVRVGYHLTMIVEDNALTFYQDIFRLPPAYNMTVGRDETHLQIHWSLNPSRELRMGSDEAYAEAFRELFTEAVRCRLRSAFPVGSLLSGGLDSSAVTCIARDLLAQNGGHRLHTISGIYNKTPRCDERAFINIVLSQGKLEPHYVQIDQLSPLTDFERVFWYGDEPFTSPTFYLGWGLYQAAHEQDVRVLLDGLDGDTAVSYGEGYLAELARAHQWAAFAGEAKALAQHENLPSISTLLQQYGVPHLNELVRRWRWVAFARGVNELSKHFNILRRNLFRNYVLKPIVPEPIRQLWRGLHGRNRPVKKTDQIINQEFAERVSLHERIKAMTGHRSMAPRTAREEHYSALTSGIMPYVFELANRASMAFSVEARHPFSDRRLLEFCLALPSEQKLCQGWTRMVMRRALAGILPEEIQWRGGKTLNSAAFTHGLLNFEGGLLEEVIMNDPSSLEPYIDVAALRETYHRYRSPKKSRTDEMKVWHAVTLALWLRHTSLAP